jgi:hypothetical protein
MIQYNSRWFAGLSNPDRMILTGLLESNNKVLDKLVEICYNMIKDSELDSSDFETPNWALRQADKVGYRRALKQVIMLCTVKDDQSQK